MLILISILALSAWAQGPAPASAPAEPIRLEVPGQPVHVSVRVPGFQPDTEALDPERMLLSGKTPAGCIVSILYEENLPFISSKDCATRYSTGRRVQGFVVGDVSCCEFKTEIRDTIVETTFQAWPVTPEYHFDIHVSFVVAKKNVGEAGTFSRNDFIALVQSFRVEGKPDVNLLAFPPELYAFRDEAAVAQADTLAWVTNQCVVHTGSWAPHLYLGLLADVNDRHSFVVQGYTRAADLLEDVKDRTPKQTRSLLFALDRAATVHAALKKYDKALEFCETAIAIPRPEDPPEIQRYREEALFNLAGCKAKLSQKDGALATLKLALEVRPDFKERAATSEMLESLRNLPEFKALVGN
jgi:hypothetical protein